MGIGAGYRFRIPIGLFFGLGGYVFNCWGKQSLLLSWEEEEDISWTDFRMDRPRVQLDLRVGWEIGSMKK